MDYTQKEVLQFVRENDVKFVRLAFCDIFGVLKNFSILSSELESAFEHGIAFNPCGIDGFSEQNPAELLLVPDPSTLTLLPWRPHEGCVARLFCDVRQLDGVPFACDTRHLFKMAVSKTARLGYRCRIGSNCEFYLFKTNEFGDPTLSPQDLAGYLDVAPLDKGENVRRDICLTLEQMDITPESSHHEAGPGQNEIDFKRSEAIYAADHFTTFKSVVKAISARNGVYASFMPKPLANRCGSGLHVTVSLYENGVNAFHNNLKPSRICDQFRAGIQRHLPEMTLFFNPLANSYERLHDRAPYNQNVYVPYDVKGDLKLEIKSPDPACNHYLAFTLILLAGVDGIESSARPLQKQPPLPETLGQAIETASTSDFIRAALPQAVRNTYFKRKTEEWNIYNKSKDDKELLFNRQFLCI